MIDGNAMHKEADDRAMQKILEETILKLNYKMEKGIFSWFEASHFDIDFENIKDTKTKYEL